MCRTTRRRRWVEEWSLTESKRRPLNRISLVWVSEVYKGKQRLSNCISLVCVTEIYNGKQLLLKCISLVWVSEVYEVNGRALKLY